MRKEKIKWQEKEEEKIKVVQLLLRIAHIHVRCTYINYIDGHNNLLFHLITSTLQPHYLTIFILLLAINTSTVAGT